VRGPFSCPDGASFALPVSRLPAGFVLLLAVTGWFARRIMEPSSAYETGQAVGRSILIGLVAFALLGGGLVFVITMIKATTSKTRGWIIGAMVSGVVALRGLLGAVGLAASGLGKAIQANKSEGDRKNRLATEDGRYRIEVPKSWKEMPELNEAAGIVAGNGFREQYVLVIENLKSDFVGDLPSFEQLTSDSLKESLENSEVSEPESRKVGAYPALHRRVVGTTEKIRVVYQISSIETADAFYQVMMWTIPSREAAALPVFREVADSFKAEAGPPDENPAAASLTGDDTRSRVVRIIVGQLGINPSKVTPTSRFTEDLGTDSLDIVELIMAVEEDFGVAIPDETAANLKTVGDLVRWIDAQAGKVEK
jgi:acyl carrier protein